MAPPDRALVLCVDEKSQIQALDRSQPLLPMWSGQVERRTHDYTRHGTTSLFAALDMATGAVIGRCYPKHRSGEFRTFQDQIKANVPADLAAIQRFCQRTQKIGETTYGINTLAFPTAWPATILLA